MSEAAQTKWSSMALAATVGAIIAFPAGILFAGGDKGRPGPEANPPAIMTSDAGTAASSPAVMSSDPYDMAPVEEAQREFDAAVGKSSPPHPLSAAASRVANREISTGQRQVAELLELNCSRYGNSCEEAKLMRRQLSER